MKPTPKLKRASGAIVAILLSLVATAAISAVEGIGFDSGTSNLSAIIQQFFQGWHGSKTMIALAALCLVLAIAGRGIERR